MKTRTVVVFLLLAAVAAGFVLLREGEHPKNPTAGVQPDSGPELAKASRPPPRKSEPPPSTPPAVKPDGATRLPATDTFESAPNLRTLADTLSAGLKRGDAEAARTMANIYDECFQLMVFPGHAASFRGNLSDLSTSQEAAALMHIDRLEQRCGDIVRTEKVSKDRLRELARQAMRADDIVALAQRLAEDPASQSPRERADAVRRIIASRNGEAIFILADAMLFSDEADNYLLRRFAGSPNDVIAWKLVGCAFGAPCGPDSTVMRLNCISIRACVTGGYREYVRHYLASPYNYEVIARTEQDILGIMTSGRIEELLH